MSSPQKPPAKLQEEAEEAEYISLASPQHRTAASRSSTPQDQQQADHLHNPPLPAEQPPPLPNEPVPSQGEDDGWEPVWDENAQAFYFFNKNTQVSQWENPRVLESRAPGPVDNGPPGAAPVSSSKSVVEGYNPAIHGDYDPNADYAKVHKLSNDETQVEQDQSADTGEAYAATGAFNRFTGKWQRADLNPENFNDESKSHRQMNAFFDVDAAANSHNGKSLKAERANKKLSKKEVKAFKEKRRERKEEKRRAWLRD